MCFVGRGWEGNVTGKQPTCLSSMPETNLLQWEYGSSVLCGAPGKQRYSKVKRQGEHLSKELDVTCAAWRMRRKELVLSVSGGMGTAIQSSRLLALRERAELCMNKIRATQLAPRALPPLLVFPPLLVLT